MNADKRLCPYCAELIQSTAVRCKFCFRESPALRQGQERAQEAPTSVKNCRYCGREIKEAAVMCRFCLKDLPRENLRYRPDIVQSGDPPKTAEAEPSRIYVPKCPHCNASIEEGVLLCGNCKTRIRWRDGQPYQEIGQVLGRLGCALTKLGCLIPILIILIAIVYALITSR